MSIQLDTKNRYDLDEHQNWYGNSVKKLFHIKLSFV